MATTLYADPMRMPFVDARTGKLTREGFLYLSGLQRGVDGLTSAEGLALFALTPSADAVADQAPPFDPGATFAPPFVAPDFGVDPGPEGRIAALEAEVSELRAALANLQQGIHS